MRILAKDIKNHLGKTIEVCGWVHRIRELGAVSFAILRDRSGTVQIVYEELPDINNESVIQVKGTVIENPKAPEGFEIQAGVTNIISQSDPELPVSVNQDPKNTSIETLLDNRFISLRIPKIRKIFSLQSEIISSFSQFLKDNYYTEIKTSKLISSGTEGGTGLFRVEYFDDHVFLAQSPQFYKQAMVASGLERVFEIGTAYRAEKHETARHLNEYVSLDLEVAFIEDEDELIELERSILKYIFKNIKEKCPNILEVWNASVPNNDEVDSIPVIDHESAKKIISKESNKRAFEITPEGEKTLCEWAKREYNIDAVFVKAFPRRKRPFYTYPDGKKTKSFDLLFRGLEITTGGQRIHDYNLLLETLPKFGLKEEDLIDYTTIFKYGCPPHGGFAIGLERLTQKILGLGNIKEASLFPRDRKRIRP
jgi:nondiscriminating aspartyl-tRNA synthetase